MIAESHRSWLPVACVTHDHSKQRAEEAALVARRPLFVSGWRMSYCSLLRSVLTKL